MLANSVRHGGRCIAGREFEEQCGGVTAGSWVRPIGPSGHTKEGEVLHGHCLTNRGQPIRVLDVVHAEFEVACPALNQPENWRLASNPVWEWSYRFPQFLIEQCVDDPEGLWNDQNSPENASRISVTAPASAFGNFSLALIRPRNFRILIQRRHDPWKGYTKQRSTGCFEYRGLNYCFRITDDAFTTQFCKASGECVRKLASPFGDNCLICVSLSAPFNGYHYKLIAAIIPITA